MSTNRLVEFGINSNVDLPSFSTNDETVDDRIVNLLVDFLCLCWEIGVGLEIDELVAVKYDVINFEWGWIVWCDEGWLSLDDMDFNLEEILGKLAEFISE